MFQTIEGKTLFVVDLQEKPDLPVHGSGDEMLEPYAKALTAAIRQGIVTEFPGKYGIEIKHHLFRFDWEIHRIIE